MRATSAGALSAPCWRKLKAGLGDDTVYGAVGKAHILLGVVQVLPAQVGVNGVSQLAGTPDGVLTGHHVENLCAGGPGLGGQSGRLSGAQAVHPEQRPRHLRLPGHPEGV